MVMRMKDVESLLLQSVSESRLKSDSWQFEKWKLHYLSLLTRLNTQPVSTNTIRNIVRPIAAHSLSQFISRWDSGQAAHFHQHCVGWKCDLTSWCPRGIWEFQLADVIERRTGWYESPHGSASALIICWHAAPSPSWPRPYLIPTETTIVSTNSLQETSRRNKWISCQPLPLFRRNLTFTSPWQ